MGDRILVIDDDQAILKIERHSLQMEGYEVEAARNGAQAIEMLQNQVYSVVILDLTLPDMDGFQVLRKIRENSSVPVIILSAKGGEADKVFGFNLGVDDYMTKPFSPVELCLRVKAILRRTAVQHQQVKGEADVLSYNDLSIDSSARQVYVSGELVELTAKEFDLLLFMIQHPNKVFTRNQLLYQIWHDDYLGSEETVTVLISRLRFKLSENKPEGEEYIKTVRGVGYKFVMA